MRNVRAYLSNAGNLHRDRESCAAEDLTALSKPDGPGAEQIGRDQALKLVKNRDKVIALLKSVDFEETCLD